MLFPKYQVLQSVVCSTNLTQHLQTFKHWNTFVHVACGLCIYLVMHTVLVGSTKLSTAVGSRNPRFLSLHVCSMYSWQYTTCTCKYRRLRTIRFWICIVMSSDPTYPPPPTLLNAALKCSVLVDWKTHLRWYGLVVWNESIPQTAAIVPCQLNRILGLIRNVCHVATYNKI